MVEIKFKSWEKDTCAKSILRAVALLCWKHSSKHPLGCPTLCSFYVSLWSTSLYHTRTQVSQRWREDLYWRSRIKFHKCFQFCNCMSLISGSSAGQSPALVVLKDSISDAAGTWGVRGSHLMKTYCPGLGVESCVHMAAQLVPVLWMLAACKEMFYQAHRKQKIESGVRSKQVVLWVPSKCPCSGRRDVLCELQANQNSWNFQQLMRATIYSGRRYKQIAIHGDDFKDNFWITIYLKIVSCSGSILAGGGKHSMTYIIYDLFIQLRMHF